MVKKLQGIHKDIIGIILATIGYLIAIVNTSGPSRFLISGIVGIGFFIILFIILKFSKKLLIFLLVVIIIVSGLGYYVTHAITSKPKVEKFTLVSGEGYKVIEKGKVNEFVQEENAAYKKLVLQFGLGNPSDISIYIKKISFEMKKYEELSRIASKITVAFKKVPTGDRLISIIQKYKLKKENQIDEIITFSTSDSFSKTVFEKLKREPEIEEVQVLSQGRGYTKIPSTYYESKTSISPKTHFIEVDTNDELKARSFTLIKVALHFAKPGKYKLVPIVYYADKRMQLQKFTVTVYDVPPALGKKNKNN